MFVRRTRTGSGATSVQVAESRPGTTDEIVEHVGSAHSAAELGVLVARAYELIDELRHQPPLDVEVPAVVVPLATEPARPANDLDPPQPALLATEDPVTAGPVDRPAQDGPGRVLGTASMLLYEALAGIYDALGFDVVDDAVFKEGWSAPGCQALGFADPGSDQIRRFMPMSA